MRPLSPLLLVAASVLMLAACGNTQQEVAAPQPSHIKATSSPSPQVTADPAPAPSRVELPNPNAPVVAEVRLDPSGNYITETAFPALTETPPPPPPEPTEPEIQPPADAYARAGHDAPEGALELPKTANGSYSLTTPSGNISCQFSTEFEGCGVLSYKVEGRYRDGETVNWFVRFAGEEEPQIMDLTGTPAFQGTATVLEQGKQAKAGDYVCASEDLGVTCWNTKTKRGFFLNRDGYQTFNRPAP